MYQWIARWAVSNGIVQWLSLVIWRTNSYLEYTIYERGNPFWMSRDKIIVMAATKTWLHCFITTLRWLLHIDALHEDSACYELHWEAVVNIRVILSYQNQSPLRYYIRHTLRIALITIIWNSNCRSLPHSLSCLILCMPKEASMRIDWLTVCLLNDYCIYSYLFLYLIASYRCSFNGKIHDDQTAALSPWKMKHIRSGIAPKQ